MNTLRRYNVEIRDLIEHINQLTHRDLGKFGTVEVRSALVPSGNPPVLENLLTTIKLVQGVAIPALQLPYQPLVLLEDAIPHRSFVGRLDKVSEKKTFTINESLVGVSLDVQVHNTGGYFLEGSGNVYSGNFPCYVYELRCISKPNISWSEPLLSPALPYYESIDDALRDWFRLKPFHGMSDGRLGSILIVIPIAQGYFGSLKLEDSVMRVEIEGDLARNSYSVTGAWLSSKDSEYRHINQSVDPQTKIVTIPKPGGADKVVLWLNASNFRDPVDHFYESEDRCTRTERVLYPPRVSSTGESDSEDAADKEIQNGENENVEFKPFIPAGDRKTEEVVKTAIAFANTRNGGRIYLGVNDYVEIVGVAREISRMYRKDKITDLNDAIKRYCSFIKKTLNDRVRKSLDGKVEPIRIAGQTVIQISIPEGRDKPYSDSRTNEVWVRRGSNTVRPDPELLSILLGKQSSPSILSHIFESEL